MPLGSLNHVAHPMPAQLVKSEDLSSSAGCEAARHEAREVSAYVVTGETYALVDGLAGDDRAHQTQVLKKFIMKKKSIIGSLVSSCVVVPAILMATPCPCIPPKPSGWPSNYTFWDGYYSCDVYGMRSVKNQLWQILDETYYTVAWEWTSCETWEI